MPNICKGCGLERCRCTYDKKCPNCKQITKVRGRCALKRPFCSHICATEYAKKQNAKTRRFHLCCICGCQTTHVLHNTKKVIIVHCNRKSCATSVRLRKNKRIQAARLKEWQSGKRKRTNHWKAVPRVSKAELVLKDWFLANKWKHQFHINTQIRNKPKSPPICYDLDFALPTKKLYVEIDGSIHRHKIESDKRRDRILQSLGWRGLRINANLIIPKQKKITPDLDAVKNKIRVFQSTH